jgi:hypothetical protein
MDVMEIVMHHRAGMDYGEESACYTGKGAKRKRKVNYKTEEQAHRVAMMMGRKVHRFMEGYPCCWCGGWHVGRRMNAAERERYFAPNPELDAKLAANPQTAGLYTWWAAANQGGQS